MADVSLSDLDWLPAVRITLEEDLRMIGVEEWEIIDAVSFVGGWVIAKSGTVPPRAYPGHRVLFIDLAEEAGA